MSATAVLIAVLGYAYTEWRYRKTFWDQSTRELSGLYVTLNLVLREMIANLKVAKNTVDCELEGERVRILGIVTGSRADDARHIAASETQVLNHLGYNELALKIATLLRRVHRISLVIEDYSAESTIVIGQPFVTDDLGLKNASSQIRRLAGLSAEIEKQTYEILGQAIETCEQFNQIGASEKKFGHLNINLSEARLELQK